MERIKLRKNGENHGRTGEGADEEELIWKKKIT